MDLEGIWLGDISQTQKDKLSYMKSPKNRTKPSSQTHRTDGWFPEEGVGGWAKWVKGVRKYKLPVIKVMGM